tara:strand:+ start:4399 stop:4620 length:222 start_codon:yes stop_codon:yes gene_type:complete
MKTTQNKRILQALEEAAPDWVSLPVLSKASGSLSPATRISNLRKQGYTIENKVEHTRNKRGGNVTTSAYRLHE